eukprot:NODE_23_length_38171_cov_0.318108.p5 type:complete len:805 gc:universal NODE_23_length_38171_cov_0.318108:2976-562(-)
MPSIIKLKILEGRNLPIMDKSTDSSDAYCVIKFDNNEQRTQTIHSLEPKWNYACRWESQDLVPFIDISVWDRDAITTDNLIGTVILPTCNVNGWFPLMDSLEGTRGEILVNIQINSFDMNISSIPIQSLTRPTFQNFEVLGLVDFIVSLKDSEYHWSDSFRTQRASNENRRRNMYKLEASLREKILEYASSSGADMVLGYKFSFDFEPDNQSVTARGIGTLTKIVDPGMYKRIIKNKRALSSGDDNSIHSDLDSKHSIDIGTSPISLSFDVGAKKRYPFCTLTNLKVAKIGGFVTVKSVKLFSNDDERDQWWVELREEVKEHMTTLRCNIVVGYQESVSVVDDVCLLQATGTACVMDESDLVDCSVYHSTFKNTLWPSQFCQCYVCGCEEVPDVILSTMDLPSTEQMLGTPKFVWAVVVRQKKEREGEVHAQIISDLIPFLEYDLHQQLLLKMRMFGKNAIFNLNWTIDVGEKLILGIAYGFSIHLTCLPPASPLAFQTESIPIAVDGTEDKVESIRRISEINIESTLKHREMAEVKSSLNLSKKLSPLSEDPSSPSPEFFKNLILDAVLSASASNMISIDDKIDRHILDVLYIDSLSTDIPIVPDWMETEDQFIEFLQNHSYLDLSSDNLQLELSNAIDKLCTEFKERIEYLPFVKNGIFDISDVQTFNIYIKGFDLSLRVVDHDQVLITLSGTIFKPIETDVPYQNICLMSNSTIKEYEHLNFHTLHLVKEYSERDTVVLSGKVAELLCISNTEAQAEMRMLAEATGGTVVSGIIIQTTGFENEGNPYGLITVSGNILKEVQ